MTKLEIENIPLGFLQKVIKITKATLTSFRSLAIRIIIFNVFEEVSFSCHNEINCSRKIKFDILQRQKGFRKIFLIFLFEVSWVYV